MRSRRPRAWLPSPQTCRRSAWRVLSPFVLSCLAASEPPATAIAEDAQDADRDAPPAAAPQTRSVAACAGDVRLFLELSVMGLLTVGLAAAALRGASHCRRLRRPQQRQDKPTCPSSPTPSLLSTLASRSAESTASVNTACRRILWVVVRAVAALSITAWAIAGLVFAASASTPTDAASSALHECDDWEMAAAATVGCVGLLVALWLLGSLVADVLTTSLIRPPNETPAALKCFRCSCCSFTLTRALVLLPLVALTAMAARSWLQTRASSASVCESKLEALFAGAALVFTLMTVTIATVIVTSAFNNQNASCFSSACCRQRSSNDETSASTGTPSNRQTSRLVVALTLAVLAVAAITWAILGFVWLSPPQAELSSARAACSKDAETSSAMNEAKVCVVALLVVGTALLATTVCCRLETFFLASGATPTVDALMLSPSLGVVNRTERVVGSPSTTTERDSNMPRTTSTPKMIAIV